MSLLSLPCDRRRSTGAGFYGLMSTSTSNSSLGTRHYFKSCGFIGSLYMYLFPCSFQLWIILILILILSRLKLWKVAWMHLVTGISSGNITGLISFINFTTFCFSKVIICLIHPFILFIGLGSHTAMVARFLWQFIELFYLFFRVLLSGIFKFSFHLQAAFFTLYSGTSQLSDLMDPITVKGTNNNKSHRVYEFISERLRTGSNTQVCSVSLRKYLGLLHIFLF